MLLAAKHSVEWIYHNLFQPPPRVLELEDNMHSRQLAYHQSFTFIIMVPFRQIIRSEC